MNDLFSRISALNYRCKALMGSVSQNFVFLPDGVYTIIFKGSSGSKSDSFSRKDVRLSRLEVIGD